MLFALSSIRCSDSMDMSSRIEVDAGESDSSDGEIADIEEELRLSSTVIMFPNKRLSKHRYVAEGEISSQIEGENKPCVVKFDPVQVINEIKSLAKLASHSHIVSLITSGSIYDITYFTLEKYHDLNLEEYICSEDIVPLYDVNRGVNFCRQIINGLKFVHEKLIIHKDLKPSNILLSHDLETVRIADFGSSQEVKSTSSRVRLLGIFGTLGYRPPESLDISYVSLKSDIFSLGVVFHFLMSNGESPFGPQSDMWDHNTQNGILKISRLPAPNPEASEHLITSMLNVERCCRPSIENVESHPCWEEDDKLIDFKYPFKAEIDECDAIEEMPTSEESDDSDGEFMRYVEAKMADFIPEIQARTDVEKAENESKKLTKNDFYQKPAIILFEGNSGHLYRLDLEGKTLTKIHKYPWRSAIVAKEFGEYIYTFNVNFSYVYFDYQCFIQRLEYCDDSAKWEEINFPKWDEEDGIPRVTASENAIFLVSEGHTKTISKYLARLDQWEKMPDKPTGTIKPAVVCSDDFLYCIGVLDESGVATGQMKRLDLTTMQWMYMANMNRRLAHIAAVECERNIYAVGFEELTPVSKLLIERYDPNTNKWIELNPTGQHVNKYQTISCLAMEGDLYLINPKQVLKYDISKNEVSNVASYPGMNFEAAVTVTIS